MQRSWLWLTLGFGLSGCPDGRVAACNDDPTRPECVVDGGVAGELTYRTHPRRVGSDFVPVQIGPCGGYLREIDWQMPDGAPEDGYIVQRIQASWSGVCAARDQDVLRTCAERVPEPCTDDDGRASYPPVEVEFWEAWAIGRGAVTPSDDGESDDTWSAEPQAVPEGWFEVIGEARYYAGRDLGDERPGAEGSPWDRHPGPPMNNRLPTTAVEPDFWRADARRGIVRRVALSWRCCPPGGTTVEEDSHDR